MIVIDFETEKITGNTSTLPPRSVGVSIYRPGRQPSPKYHAWGHPEGTNNTTFEKANAEIRQAFHSGEELLFHNAKFDIAVAQAYHGVVISNWLKIYDTMYDIFLTDPYSPNLSLKPSAKRLLGMDTDEQDEVEEWVMANLKHLVGRRRSEWGGYISLAPGNLVGKYANGDTLRTWKLFEHLHPKVIQEQMMAAYRREQRLLPHLMESERNGIRVDIDLLAEDNVRYQRVRDTCDNRIRTKLRNKTLNIDSNAELAAALEKAGMMDMELWPRTPGGALSTAKDALDAALLDPALAVLLRYRGALDTCLSTFAGPWLAAASGLYGDNRIHTTWNQVRQSRGDGGASAGTKTGRMSSERPNFQNIPNPFDIEVPKGLPPMMTLRKYLLPEEGHVWIKRDFSGQEMRVAAHYEERALYEAYRANPDLDPHGFVQRTIKELLDLDFVRKDVKIIGFQILYGGGATAVSKNLKVSYQQGKEFREVYFTAMPGLRALSNATRNRGKSGDFIKTWGGRRYRTEKVEAMPDRDLSYRLLNYLIQGSAADLTKQTMVDWFEKKSGAAVFLAAVHDELNASVPEEDWQEHMAVLKETMHTDHLDVPMRSEGFVGSSWHNLEECA